MTLTAMRNSTVYVVVYDTISFSVLRFLLPLLLITIFNAGLIRALHQSQRLTSTMRAHQQRWATGSKRVSSNSAATQSVHAEASSRSSDDAVNLSKVRGKHSTVMLVVVVVVFALCELPDMTLRVYLSLRWLLPYDRDRHILLYVNVVSNFLLTANASVNFIIYIVLGRKFRAIFVAFFCSVNRRSPVA